MAHLTNRAPGLSSMQITGLTDDTKSRNPQSNFVYGLYNPVHPSRVRYIGRTNKPEMRLRFHRSFASYPSPKDAWIYELVRNGLQPEMVTIESGDGEAWAKAREKHYIKEYEQILNAERFAREVPRAIKFVWMQLYHILIRFEVAKQLDTKAKAMAAKNPNIVYSDPEEDWHYHDSTGFQAVRALEVLAKEYPALASVSEWARIG